MRYESRRLIPFNPQCRLTKAARFPAYKDLASFDFAASEANEATIRQLHQGESTNRADNVVLIGGPGTGKTHIATALGVQAIEHGRKKVRFYSTVDLVNLLEQEKTANKAGHLAESLLRLDLVILDELGICRSARQAGHCCFTCSEIVIHKVSFLCGYDEPLGAFGHGSLDRFLSGATARPARGGPGMRDSGRQPPAARVRAVTARSAL